MCQQCLHPKCEECLLTKGEKKEAEEIEDEREKEGVKKKKIRSEGG